MTTGNISSADMMAAMISAKSQNGVISQGSQATDSFSDIFSQKSANGADAFSSNSMDFSDVRDTDSVRNAFDKNTSNKTKEILSAQKEGAVVSEESLTELPDNIKNIIIEKLDITEEELMDAMADAGLTFADLLVPQNVSKLIAQIENVEPAMIVTDSQLSETLADIVSAVNELLNQIAADSQLPVEDIEGAFRDMLNKDTSLGQENKTQEVIKTVTVVTDAETGKEMTITMEGDRVTQTATETANVTEASVMNEDSQNEKNLTDNGQNGQSEGFAANIFNNLTDSIQNSTTVQGDFSQMYGVNQSEVITQIIDSIRVNVTADTSSMELQLTPESLGKINLTVVAKDGNITASITAQNEAVKAVIESQLLQLKEALNNQGLKVTEVEVMVAQQGFNESFEGGNNGSQNNQTNNRRRFRGIDELVTDIPDSEDFIVKEIMEQEGNSVNFKA